MLSYFLRQFTAALMIVVLGAACADDPLRVIGPEDGDAVLRLPDDAIYRIAAAPDSTLFVSTFKGFLYRSAPKGEAPWSKVAQLERHGRPHQELLMEIEPLSKISVFAAVRQRLYQWSGGEGLREHRTLFSDSSVHCGDFTTGALIEALFGRDPQDVYAVGHHGHVLHFNGSTWNVEPNPMKAQAPSLCYGAYHLDLNAVGADARHVYAAAGLIMRTSGNGRWEFVPGPAGPDTTAAVMGIASNPAGPLFALQLQYGERAVGTPVRFFRLRALDDRWEEIAKAPPRIHTIYGGGRQPGGLALFWNYDQAVTIHGRRVRLYEFPHLNFRGAVAVGPTIFAAGSRGDTAIVIRVRP